LKWKENDMKAIKSKSVLIAALCGLAVSFGTAAYAEKGAERLLNKPSPPAAKSVSTPSAHSCRTCADTLVTSTDKGTKGPNHLVSKVARHDCTTCTTKIATEGIGKAKRDVAIHSCNGQTKPLCCAKN
jgi:hypothetical protein